MNDELVPIKPEVVRNPDGSFAPGHVGGLNRGVKHQLTKLVREAYAKHAEQHGDAANPMIVMSNIMMDEKLPAHVRLQAAFRLTSFIMPKLVSFDAQPEGTLAEETLTITRKLKAYFTDAPV